MGVIRSSSGSRKRFWDGASNCLAYGRFFWMLLKGELRAGLISLSKRETLDWRVENLRSSRRLLF